MPVRLKAIHIVNVSSLSEKVLSMVKPFLRKDMMDLVSRRMIWKYITSLILIYHLQIHMHPKIDSVYDYIPKEALPKEYGGKAGTFKELHGKYLNYISISDLRFISFKNNKSNWRRNTRRILKTKKKKLRMNQKDRESLRIWIIFLVLRARSRSWISIDCYYHR